MRVAVTGASGFIGSNLCEYLAKHEHAVVPIVRTSPKAARWKESGFDVAVCDVTDQDGLRRAFEKVDVVMHLAALFNRPECSWDDYRRINVGGTRNVLEAARANGVGRVIHCSTVGVATGNGVERTSERAPYAPPSWDKYETTKCEAEQLALEFHATHGFPVSVIRPAQVYGPGDRSKAKFYRLVKKGIIVNPGKTLKHLIFIDDLCRAFELAATNDRAIGEVFIIGGIKAVPLRELTKVVARELHVPPPRVRLPATPITWLCTATETVSEFLGRKPPLYRRSMDFFTKSVHFDVSKAEEQLGFRSEVNILTGVAKTARWYQEQQLV